ncbi:MAG: hypothetical protein ABW034_16700 [Steroidobacteraceae bacterium]
MKGARSSINRRALDSMASVTVRDARERTVRTIGVWSERVEIRLAPRLSAFAGMRWFRFDLTEGGGHEDLQDEVFVGVGYRR